MSERSKKLWRFLVDLDTYIGAVIFIVILFLLTLQVISRYVFNFSLTWTEELSVALFVLMTYFGVSSAVTYRKHLRIDALLDVVPYHIKKALLIISDVIFICFNSYIVFPFFNIIIDLGPAKSPILGIPKALVYFFIPLMLTISSMKLIADIYKLAREKKKEIGSSKPAIDFERIEKEAEAMR